MAQDRGDVGGAQAVEADVLGALARRGGRPRRSGIASLLLGHILTEARRMGFTQLSLETGAAGFVLPARKLYGKFGFDYCEPFADYQPDPNSVFMTRLL